MARNFPNINPNGAKWRRVRALAPFSFYDQRQSSQPTRPYVSMMAQIGRYIEAGFSVQYREDMGADGTIYASAEARP